MQRCSWAGEDPLYICYHDREWGRPILDGDALFELLLLEGMQAGLSWLTVLKKREEMRKAFFGFDANRLARCGQAEYDDWLSNTGLIRHRGKLNAVITNAKARLALASSAPQFSDWLWQFTNGQTIVNHHAVSADVPSTSPASEAMSKALKKAGFKFVGPTICYAFMQSGGMVCDHLITCPAFAECADLARRPT
ncbi:MAG: DNA-3-methyladenine glycosylase I [Pseudomonadaceae bacterium]|nr:DNA-3-methyladenine glycosylase I [Pseudomonadaceae bacterium]